MISGPLILWFCRLNLSDIKGWRKRHSKPFYKHWREVGRRLSGPDVVCKIHQKRAIGNNNYKQEMENCGMDIGYDGNLIASCHLNGIVGNGNKSILLWRTVIIVSFNFTTSRQTYKSYVFFFFSNFIVIVLFLGINLHSIG